MPPAHWERLRQSSSEGATSSGVGITDAPTGSVAAGTPVTLTSGVSDPDRIKEVEDLRPDAFFGKPVDTQQLLSALMP